MKVLIEFPKPDYDNFLLKCPVLTPEHALLKNAVVESNTPGMDQPVITILCDEPEAKYLLATAEALHIPAVQHVRRALDILHTM